MFHLRALPERISQNHNSWPCSARGPWHGCDIPADGRRRGVRAEGPGLYPPEGETWAEFARVRVKPDAVVPCMNPAVIEEMKAKLVS